MPVDAGLTQVFFFVFFGVGHLDLMVQSFGCNLGFFWLSLSLSLSLSFFFFPIFFLSFSGVCFPWTYKKLCVCV
jgi:hypothetical protein